jgi:hypothetical protein
MVRKLRPLLASYGGGHVQILAALARGFISRGDQPDVIGFTTAYAELGRQGIAARSVSALLDQAADGEWLALAEDFTSGTSHPDIHRDETRAYFALGLRDLAGDIGRESAVARVRSEGRTAFEPVGVMRRYLRRMEPDIVVTTTSPRFECALLKAARLEGIPNLAVGDLFLVQERAWILQPDYAEHLAVLSGEVAHALVAEGFPQSGIRVTGNPVFDRLAPGPEDVARRAALRAQLDIEDKVVILFPAPGAHGSMDARPFLELVDVIAAFEDLCRADPQYAYILRQHPNRPMSFPEGAQRGILDDGTVLSPEAAILVSDIVCVDVSTMGLQAALAGKPVICIAFGDYVLYPKFGIGQEVANMDEAISILKAGHFKGTARLDMPPLGSATANVLSFVDDIVAQHPDSPSLNRAHGDP